jgi:hydrogenase expression/formation protein HypD
VNSSTEQARQLLDSLRRHEGEPLCFMEVCGTHTMAMARAGLRGLLPETIRLVSGPGCPVCVTPVGYVDHALALARIPAVTIATFGDLIRVPGSGHGGPPPSLQLARASGGDVRVVYSPLDALELARRNPERQVVLLGVGFETTAPAVAAVLLQAHRAGVDNFTVLAAHRTIPEAMEVLASSPRLALQGFLCPGHVSIILGQEPYEPLARRHGLACAIAGFEPVEILRGLVSLVSQLREGRPRVVNCYEGAVRAGGNPRAREVMYRVFEPCDSEWRGLGTIPGSGLRVRETYRDLDAAHRFEVALPAPEESPGCRCGEVLQGILDPADCPLFGRACIPEHPRGACMVSSEGSCAARYHYGREDLT